MIQCFVTSTSESENIPGPGGGRSARQVLLDSLLLAESISPEVRLVGDPGAADVVLFAERHSDDLEQNDAIQRIIQMPTYREHRRRVVVHSGKDIPRPLIPGLYPSISQRWARVLGCQGAPYLTEPNSFLQMNVEWDGRVEKLASFVGHCEQKPVREKLLSEAIRMRWSDISVQDTSKVFISTLRSGDSDGHNALKRLFVRDLLNAKFALCPKGVGLSSFRVFEAMEVGRAPVIIANGWSAPPGPDWDSFAIRVSEQDIERLPIILRERESEWEHRGKMAQAAWRQFYSPERLGVTIVRQAYLLLDSLKSRRAVTSALARVYVYGPRQVAILRKRITLKLERALSISY